MASRAIRVLAVTTLVLLGAVACQSEGTTRRLTVAVDIVWSGSVCKASDGADLEGLSIRVTDEDGEEVARARLGPGGPPPPGEWVRPASRVRICRFRAVVEVPDRTSYTVVAGGGPPLTFTQADLDETEWVAIVLPPEDLGA